MQNRYRRLLLAVIVLSWTVGGGAERALAATFSEFPIPTAGSSPNDITSGPDGNLWFTETGADTNGVNHIGRITTAGAITEFPIPTLTSNPAGITAGPDGNLWFTENGANKIGRITTSGVVTEFAIPTAGSGPQIITTGPDGALWFTEFDVNQIGRITTDGTTIAEFLVPTADSGPQGITTGPDGALWFTELNGNKNGRLAPTIVNTHDLNGDGKSDIVWRDTSGNIAIWEMNGTTILNPNTAGDGKVNTTLK